MTGHLREPGATPRWQMRLERRRRLPRPGIGPMLVLFVFAGVVLGYELLQSSPLAPADGSERTLCMLRATTGVPCPGCGSTRAVKAAAMLRPGEALRANPMVCLLGAGVLLALGLRLVTGRVIRFVLPAGTWTTISVLFVLMLLLNWWWVLRAHGFTLGG